MIFIAKNEKGEHSWKLIQEDRKTVTRRPKPLPVDKEFAVCKVISCMHHRDWIKSQSKSNHLMVLGMPFFNKEAHKEGFDSWYSLVNWFYKRGQDIESMFRIEFERLN